MKLATCSCGYQSFIVTDEVLQCSECGFRYAFKFKREYIQRAHDEPEDVVELCLTKADEIVRLVNEGY